MNKIEDIFDVLLEGTKAQIDALEGCGASYRYSMESGTFTVSLGRDEIRRTSCSTSGLHEVARVRARVLASPLRRALPPKIRIYILYFTLR